MTPIVNTILTRLWYLLTEGAYIPREYYVFDDLRLVYMPIYKVGSTSIKTSLLRADGGVATYPQYMSVHDSNLGHHHLTHHQRRHYYKFAFVRNPFDRLVSCYEDRVRRPIYAPIERHYFDTRYNNNLIRSLFGRCFDVDMTFSDFVELVARIPDILADGHFKSQYGWTHRRGEMIPNYIGRLECLAADWQPIATRYGVPEPETRNASMREDTATYFQSARLVDLAAKRVLEGCLGVRLQERVLGASRSLQPSSEK